MPQLDLTLFGSFQLNLNGQPVERLRSVREAALLAYLAVEAEHAHPRTHLAGLLWPDLPEVSARNNLKQTLLNLRETIQDRDAQPPFLYAERTTLQFNRDSAQRVDVLILREALKATAQHAHTDRLTCTECQARLVMAVALYRGPLLATFTLAQSDLFEEWLLLTREHFHRQVIDACALLSASYTQQGNHAEALAYIRRQTELDPFHEPAHRQLFKALVTSGDRSGALVQFDQFNARLHNELGVGPSPETLTLIEQIRHAPEPTSFSATDSALGALSSTPSSIISSPIPLSPIPSLPKRPISPATQHDWGGTVDPGQLIERTEEVTQLTRWLQSGMRVITLWGLAGVGKTALAQAVARRQAAEFSVVIWRSLRNAPPLTALLPDWLALLTGQLVSNLPQTIDLQLNLLFDKLRQQRVLLVLDNLEHIMREDRAGRFRASAEDYGQLFQRLAQDDHQSVLLLTSREQPQMLVRLEEETPAIRALRLAGLTQAGGQQLLTDDGLILSTQDAASIVQRFSGNPIILKFVAHSIQEIFGGDVTAFLAAETLVYGEIRDLFYQYQARVPTVERDILRWFAIACEPIAVTAVEAAMRPSVSPSIFLEAIHALQRRALLEADATGFAVPQVVTNIIIEHFLELMTHEIINATPALLNDYRLINDQATDAIRQAQFHQLIVPLAERLRRRLGQVGLLTQLQQLLDSAYQIALNNPGYLVENLANLLLYVTHGEQLAADGPPSPALMLTAKPSMQLPLVSPLAKEMLPLPSGQAQREKPREVTRPPHTPAFLPAQFTPLIGRERELAEIVERLQQPTVHLLTLIGAGGIGKTTLALAVGQAIDALRLTMFDSSLDSSASIASRSKSPIQTLYPDGVFFVALAPLTNAAALPSAIATTLGLSLQGGEPHLVLSQQLRHKHLLLILDNVEHLLHEMDETPGEIQGEMQSGIEFIVALLQSAPGVRLLATSRERLNLRGEHLYPVPPLAFAEQASPAEIAAAPAVRLFVQSAQRGAADFTLTAENLALVLRICRLVQGIPLGLELAAANVGLLPLAEIADEIERSAEFLAVDWRDVPKRQRSMRAVFDWSWQLLAEVERHMLRRIAIFRGGFTREAAQQVTGAGLPALTGLMRKSLLQSAETGSAGERFQIHELLRQFAEEHLSGAPQEKQQVQTQHATYYLHWLAAQGADLVGPRSTAALHAIETELGNINGAWLWAVEQSDTSLLDAALVSLRHFYALKGRAQEGTAVFEQAAARLDEQSLAEARRLTFWRIRAFQSSLLIDIADFERAHAYLEDSLPMLRRQGTPTETAFCLGTMGLLAYRTGNYHEAKQRCQAAIDLYSTLNDARGLAINVNILGLVNCDLGEYDEARRLHQENLARRRAHHDLYGTIFTLNNLGAVAAQRQDYAEAQRLYDEAMTLAQKIDYRSGISLGLLNLGSLAYRRGKSEAALHLAQSAMRVTQEINDHRNVVWALANLGNASYALGNYGDAARYLHEAAQLALSLRAVPRALAALTSIAALDAATGNLTRAVELASLCLAHPASQKETQSDASALLATLPQRLPHGVISEVQTHAQTRTLEQIVATLT